MRIRTKLTVIIVFIIFCFVSLIVLFNYINTLTGQFVEKEKETILLGIKWSNLINLTSDLLLNDWKFEDIAESWRNAVQKFDNSLLNVTSSKLLRSLGKKITGKIDTIQSVWELTKKNHSEIEIELNKFISRDNAYPQRPLLFLYGYYYTKEEERGKFYELSELNRLILNF